MNDEKDNGGFDFGFVILIIILVAGTFVVMYFYSSYPGTVPQIKV